MNKAVLPMKKAVTILQLVSQRLRCKSGLVPGEQMLKTPLMWHLHLHASHIDPRGTALRRCSSRNLCREGVAADRD